MSQRGRPLGCTLRADDVLFDFGDATLRNPLLQHLEATADAAEEIVEIVGDAAP